ncbi:MAG: RHS repeat-associated protein, partial [Arenicella sp.]
GGPDVTLIGDDTPVAISSGGSSGGSSNQASFSVPVEPTLMHTAMIYPDGKRVRYQYRYDPQSESYMILEVNSDGVERERWFDLDGQVRYHLVGGRVAGVRVRNGSTAVERDSYGNRTVVKYNRFEAVESVSYPDGTTISKKYLSNYNFPTLRTDQMGVENKHEYDFSGNRIKSIYGFNTDEQRIVEYEYDTFGQLSKVRAIGDANTPTSEAEYKYDLFGNIIEVKDPRGNVTLFKDYNSAGQYQTYIDARLKTWKMTFDAFGNRLSSISPLGFATHYEYDSLHRLSKYIDPENRESEFKYDSRNSTIESINNVGGKVKYTRRMDGGTKTRLDEIGRTTAYGYDRVGRLVGVTDAVGNRISVSYLKQDEVAGFRPEKIEGPNMSLRLAFDPLFRITELTQLSVKEDGLALNSKFTYNARGERTSVTDANGLSTHWAYNSYGQPATVTNAENEVVTNNYDARGNLQSVKNALGQVHRFEYDHNSNLVRQYRPMGEAQNYVYDAINNVISMADYLNNSRTFTHDADGRMVRQTNTKFGSTVAERVVNYTLDNSGLPKSVEDANSSVSYIYDGLARLREQTTVFHTGGLPIVKTLKNSYYANSQLQSRTDAEGIKTAFIYDAAGKFKQLNIAGVGAISVADYEGNLAKTMSYPGGLTREYNYDGLSRLSKILVTDNASNTKMDYGYAYDNVGNITERTTQQGAYKYEYDNVYRLTSAEQPSIFGNQTIEYDDNGSRSELTNSQGASSYVYNDNNELTSIQNALGSISTSTSMSYDANGALLSESAEGGDTTDYNYTSYGRLNTVEKNGGELATYEYDPQGRRISKTVAGETTYFLYDDTGVGLVGEYDISGNLIRGYSYHVNSHFSTNPVTQKTPNGSGGYEFDFYQNDHVGSPQMMVATSGATTWQGEYDAFGKTHVVASSKTNPLRFAGQYYDVETNNHQNWNRYYRPSEGRYASSDPIGLAGGINTYGYAGGNPINNYDPNGLWVVAVNPYTVTGVAFVGYGLYCLAAECGGMGELFLELILGIERLARLIWSTCTTSASGGDDGIGDDFGDFAEAPSTPSPDGVESTPAPPPGGPDDDDEFVEADRSNSPIKIPRNAKKQVQKKEGYDQVRYRWKSGKHRYEARWHTETGGAPTGSGSSWVIKRRTAGNPFGQRSAEHTLTRTGSGANRWVPQYEWQAAIRARTAGTASRAQQELLRSGHFK